MVAPKYFVTGVWKDDKGRITHYCVHINGKSGFGKGKQLPASELIRLVKSGQQVRVLRWNYQSGNWIIGDALVMTTAGGSETLGVRPGASRLDHPQNLINFTAFNNAPSQSPEVQRS